MINRLLKTIFILLAVSLMPVKSSAQQTCPWEVNPHDYQYDMSLYLGCRLDLTDLDSDRYTVGAFVGEDCRGIGEKFTVQGMEAPVVYLRARSNTADGENLSFRCFDTQTGDIYDAATEIPFVSNEHIGFPTEPFTMQFYNQYAPLAGITVSPGSLSVKRGMTGTLEAALVPDNALPTEIVWSSSDTSVATVADGVVTAEKTGEAVITASAGGYNATCEVTVLPPDPTAITLTPGSVTLLVGESATFTYAFEPSDATAAITWESSDTAVATVADGVVTAVFPGNATVTVTTENGVTATAEVTVKPIEVTAVTVSSISGETSLKGGETLALSVTVNPDNATYKSVTWSSSDETVATVDSEGNVKGIVPGDVTITATAVNGVSGSIELKVLPILVESIVITPSSIESQPGNTYQLTATVLPENASDNTLVWSSSDENVASVSASGLVTVTTVGEAIITAEAADGSGVKATCTVSVVTGIADIIAEGSCVAVYTVDGLLLTKEADKDFIHGLSQGTYIIVSDGKAVRFRK